MSNQWTKQFIAIIVSLILGVSTLFAQTSRYEFMSSYPEFDSTNVHQLHFRFENHNFFRNNEYQSDAIDGYTLIGLWARPVLEYYPAANLKIRIGGHFLRYHGINFIDKSNSIPYYSIQYNPFNKFEIILGNFDNSNPLYMPEMLYSPELFLFTKPPGGVQARYANNFMQSRIWLNWETFIQENDPFQEVFTQGASVAFFPVKTDFIHLSIPIHFTYHHRGGEIDSSDELIETLMNGSAGLQGVYEIDNWETGAEVSYLGYRETTNNRLQPFAAGHAGLARAFIKYNTVLISAGYWQANGYLSPKGSLIYKSYTSTNDGQSGRKRQLLESRFVLNIPVKYGVRFAVEADAYFDIITTKLSYMYGIHLVFSESFFSRKIKRRIN